MRIKVNLTREETKEALTAYSLHYSSRLLRFVEKSGQTTGLGLSLVAFGMMFRHDSPAGPSWQALFWPAMFLMFIGVGLQARRLPSWRFPHGNERVMLFNDESISIQNLFGRVVRRERWSHFAPVIETTRLYLMVSPRSLDLPFGGFVRRRLYIIPKRLLSTDAVGEFRQLLQVNLRRYPAQISRIAS
jgi:hypothetical protein